MLGDEVLTAAPATSLVFAALVQGDSNAHEIVKGIRELDDLESVEVRP